MAGHGGLGLGLMEDVPDLERVVVPVGGGGLVSGVASGLKAADREIEVIGVQSDGYPLWPRSFEAGGGGAIKPRTNAQGAAPAVDRKMVRVRTEDDRPRLTGSEP